MASEVKAVTICLQDHLLREIEKIRKKAMQEEGHVSRSNICRRLLSKGVAATNNGGREKQEAANC